MSLPAVSIERHVLAWMLSALFVLFGLLSYERLGIDRFPHIDFPRISITTTLPGANPDIIDASITNVIETAVNSVPGIRHLQSSSYPGVSVTNLTFAFSRDSDAAFNEVQAKVNQILKDLPEDADQPVVAKMEFGATPIMWVSIYGDRTLQQLNQYARTVVKKRLENVDGVAEVRIAGRRDRTIRVNLNLERMSAYGITTQDLVRAFQDEHFQLPGGFVVGNATERMIKLDLEYHDVEELEHMIVVHREGAPVRLRDVSVVEDGVADFRRLARFNGQTAVGLGIVKVTGSNTVAILKEVRRRLTEEIRPALPPGVFVEIATDDGGLIEELVEALNEHLILGTFLTAFVVVVFLKSIRAMTIVLLAIPVSLLGSVAVMYFFGFTFNTLTLLALLLLIGVVVDDAIVVLENIFRHRQQGVDAVPAAIDGTNQVVFAVLASTLTLVSIFAPVVFLDGVIGQMFKPFALVVVVGVLVSWFVSMTLTPMLCSRYLVIAPEHGRVYHWLERLLVLLDRAYKVVLRWALASRWLVVLVTVVVIGTSGYFLGQLGSEFLPEEDESSFVIHVSAPLGSTVRYTGERLSLVEKELAVTPEVESYFSAVGTGETGQAHRAQVFVRLVPRDQRSVHMYEVIDRMRHRLAALPGVRAFPARPAVGGGRGEPLQFVLLGRDIAEVARLSALLQGELARLPALGPVDLDLQLELPQLEVDVNRTLAADLGLTSREVAQAVNIIAGGYDVAKFNDEPGDGERYDVRLKSRSGTFAGAEDLRNIYLRGRHGRMIRLDTVVDLRDGLGPAVVPRYDLRYSATFFSNPRVSMGEATELVLSTAQDILPPGYHVELIGQSEEFVRTRTGIMIMFAVAIVLVYMVLASQFNSFLQPLIVMVAQPLAVVGGGAALWLTNTTLNMFSMIGLVLLMGLVAKNSILLVDLTNQMRARGLGIREALLDACPLRLRPILMTSFTVILTMLPVSLGVGAGADTSGPLAVAVVGGMLSSTLLTLLVVPTVYAMIEEPLFRYRTRTDAASQLRTRSAGN